MSLLWPILLILEIGHAVEFPESSNEARWWAGVGAEARLEQSLDGQRYEGHPFARLTLARMSAPWRIQLEGGMSQDQSQTGNYSIRVIHYELMGWTHWGYDWLDDWTFYFGAGVGARTFELKTQLGDELRRDRSDWEPLLGIETGLGFWFHPNWRLETVGRALKARDQNSLLWSLGFGVQFNL